MKQKTQAAKVYAATSAGGVAWDLSNLFSGHDDPRLAAAFGEIQARADEFASEYRGTIAVKGGPSPQHLLAMLVETESLMRDVTRLSYFAYLSFAADTRADEHRALVARVEALEAAFRNTTLFAELEWLAVDEADAARLVKHPVLANYRHFLKSARRFKPHTLSEPEERVINEKDLTGVSAWQRFFTEFNSATVFRFRRDGTDYELNQSQILTLLRDPVRATRQRAWQVFYDTLRGRAEVLSYVYDTRFNDHLIASRLRGYAEPMAMRNTANDIDGAAVRAMLNVAEKNYPVAHRYWKLKAKLLGLPKIELFDQYAPLFKAKERISYAESKQIVLDALGAFEPKYAALARQFFDQNWIDADPRDGKQGGAFCAGLGPDDHPYILVNYTDDLRDVMTVAHELGHGLHACLAQKQTMLNFQPSLPVAETASVFAEMLVFERVFGQLTDDNKKLALICGKLEDSFATVFRQAVMTRFEELAYAERAKGRLTEAQIGDLWLKANAPYYGKGVKLTPGYELGWAYIPHFIHTPFYCYAYSFGELLVLALYGMYRRAKADGRAADFVARYTAMLEAGGSRSPAELGAGLGIDVSDAAFWQVGFDELARWVQQAEALGRKVASAKRRKAK